jgi:hypothetical protein
MSKKRKKAGLQNITFLLSSFVALVAGIILVGWADRYSIVWRYSMFLNAPNLLVGISTIIVAFAVAPIITWFKKQVTSHPRNSNPNNGIWIPILLIAFPLLMCTTQIGIVINGALDKSEAKTFHTVVLTKWEVHTMRANSRYIKVEDWNNPGKSVQISISDSNYRAIQIGDSINIVTKKGMFGYEWMVDPDFMKGKWPFELPDN